RRTDRAGQAVLYHDVFAHEGPILAEHLSAVVAAIRDKDQALLRQTDAVYRVGELLRGWRLWIVGELVVRRWLPVGAPHPLERARRRVKDDDAVIEVA